MSTRGCIARLTSKPNAKRIKFTGRYNHSDSYPSGLGSTLFQLRNGYFKKDTNAMLKVLIDEHPAGWSSIFHADFSIPAGFINKCPYESEMNEKQKKAYELYLKTPRCYCHGDRHERDLEITEQDANCSDCEYVYAFPSDGKTMLVLDFDNSKATWKKIGVIDLDEIEPTNEQWDKIPIQQVTKKLIADAIETKMNEAEKKANKKIEDDTFAKSALSELLD